MFERFTERARQVVVLAQEEARARRNENVTTMHLLMGLIREEEGLAARVLEKLEVTMEAVRERLALLPASEEPVTSNPPFTPEMKKTLELALREALSLGHNYIGTEHVLLGLVRDPVPTSQAAVFLASRQSHDANAIRTAVINALAGPRPRHRPEAPPKAPTPRLPDDTTAEKREFINSLSFLTRVLTDALASYTAREVTAPGRNAQTDGGALEALVQVRQRLAAIGGRLNATAGAEEALALGEVVRDIIDPAIKALRS